MSEATTTAITTTSAAPRSLVTKFASRYGVEPNKMLETLKATAFKQPSNGAAITNEQMMALLVVADQYGLNPFTKEVYAFPDKRGGIVPVVGVDGWARIINEHPQFDGMSFDWPNDDGTCCVCTIYRKDRAHPIAVPEYLIECKRNTEPWTSHPRRMLRHKALIQCARVAFGFAGIFDPDEAKRIEAGGYIDAETGEVVDGKQNTGLAAVRAVANGTTKPKATKPAKAVAADPVVQQSEHGIEQGQEPAVRETTVRDVKGPPSREQAPPPKAPDDPSAGAVQPMNAREMESRKRLIEKAKTREDALIVVDEVRGDVPDEQLDVLMVFVNKAHPEQQG